MTGIKWQSNMKEYMKTLCEKMNWQKYLKIPEFLRISGKEVEKVLLSIIIKGSKVLDIGCGYGRISLFLKNQGFDVTAVDNEKEMVKYVKQLGIKSFLMNAEKLKFKNNLFNLVVTDGLLEHFENPEKILAEEKRVSKEYVINFIPINTFWNKILEFIQRTPKVFWRSEKEWFLLHREFFNKVEVKNLKRLDAFICKK